MKTQLKFVACMIACIFFFLMNGRAQDGSANTRKLMDSLKITDADEIAICNLYDEAVTGYLKELEEYSANGMKPTPAQSAGASQRFQFKVAELDPRIESLRKKIAANNTQLVNFNYFCNYETVRVYGTSLPGNGRSPF